VKQGSGGPLPEHIQRYVLETFDDQTRDAHISYEVNIESLRLCREQARFLLPANTMTRWWWTGSLYFFARVAQLRGDPHAQAENRTIVREIDRYARDVAPVSWAALTRGLEL
jgi:thymidylate synthase (FAD)